MDERIGDFPDLTALDAEVAIELYPETFPVRWDLCGATADFFATQSSIETFSGACAALTA